MHAADCFSSRLSSCEFLRSAQPATPWPLPSMWAEPYSSMHWASGRSTTCLRAHCWVATLAGPPCWLPAGGADRALPHQIEQVTPADQNNHARVGHPRSARAQPIQPVGRPLVDRSAARARNGMGGRFAGRRTPTNKRHGNGHSRRVNFDRVWRDRQRPVRLDPVRRPDGSQASLGAGGDPDRLLGLRRGGDVAGAHRRLARRLLRSAPRDRRRRHPRRAGLDRHRVCRRADRAHRGSRNLGK